MPLRGMMATVTELEKTTLEAGIDLNGEIRKPLDRPDPEVKDVEPEEHPELDGGPVSPSNQNLPTGQRPRSSLPPSFGPSTSRSVDGSSCSHVIRLLFRHLIFRADKKIGEMKSPLASWCQSKTREPASDCSEIGISKVGIVRSHRNFYHLDGKKGK